MTETEKGAGKSKRATNDLAETPFSMVKETKRRCGTNMSINKCAGEAMMRANDFVDQTMTNKGIVNG